VYPPQQPTTEPGPPVQAVEFRAAPRYRVLQRCFLRPPGVGGPEGWRGIVFSLSATGIGVTLPLPLERGTEVEVEAWNLPAAKPLRARVVHVSRLEFVWLAGCELVGRLADDHLAAWLTTATAGP
jgi:hypothetical protein